MQKANGFSLIELLIVVVIIGIVVAIAAPNLISARRSADESSAVSALRVLHGANAAYFATAGAGNYAGTASTPGPSSLQALAGANLVDSQLGSGNKSGFNFTGSWEPASGTGSATFYFSANPTIPSGVMQSGARRFGLVTDGVMKVDAAPASLAVPFDFTSLAAAP